MESNGKLDLACGMQFFFAELNCPSLRSVTCYSNLQKTSLDCFINVRGNRMENTPQGCNFVISSSQLETQRMDSPSVFFSSKTALKISTPIAVPYLLKLIYRDYKNQYFTERRSFCCLLNAGHFSAPTDRMHPTQLHQHN